MLVQTQCEASLRQSLKRALSSRRCSLIPQLWFAGLETTPGKSIGPAAQTLHRKKALILSWQTFTVQIYSLTLKWLFKLRAQGRNSKYLGSFHWCLCLLGAQKRPATKRTPCNLEDLQRADKQPLCEKEGVNVTKWSLQMMKVLTRIISA